VLVIVSILISLSSCFASSVSTVEKVIPNGTIASARSDFELCRKKSLENCTYFKAVLLERQGNAGSAMELYLRAGFFEDYIRLKALSGQKIEDLLRKYNLSDFKKTFYRGLFYFSKGKWSDSINKFSKKVLKKYTPAIFYTAYARIMLGQISEAKEILNNKPSELSSDDKLYYDKLNAIILYAENKQLDALKIFKSVLKNNPEDFIALKYSAHIYYRTGWFDKAEKIYSSLVGKEWKDTELYYLLSERCEMRVRYSKFNLAQKDAKKIIKEFPQRKDFIPQFISWLLEYSNLDLAKKYLKDLSNDERNQYQASLFYFASGLIDSFELKDKDALEKFKKAESIYPTAEYKQKIKEAEQNLISYPVSDYPKFECKKFNISREKSKGLFVSSNIFGEMWPIRYLVSIKDNKYFINLNLVFKYSKEINFEDHKKSWLSFASKTWSNFGMILKINLFDNPKIDKEPVPKDLIIINIAPWPSAFYIQRTSSHQWNILNPPIVVAHEVGHLMGLDDEYYETDARIYKRTKNRFIGPRASIMRNVLSGEPQKMHIHFILSPIKCKN
jgi:hypothetical protein